jgi:hypothetical protein
MMEKWEMFVADKPYWDLKKHIVRFEGEMARVNALSASSVSASR